MPVLKYEIQHDVAKGILVKYWSNSSKKNSNVSKRKLTSLNPPLLRCLNLYTDAYMPRGALGGRTQN